MKRFLPLLSTFMGLAASLSAQTANDSYRPASHPQGADKARQDAAIARAVRAHKCVYYITDYTATGSHIPQVVTRYEGHNIAYNSFTRGRVYSSDDIGLTGSLDVGGALRSLDPAITIR